MARRDLKKHAIHQILFGVFWILMTALWWDGVDPATRRFILVTIFASTHMSVAATMLMIHREQKSEQSTAASE